MDAFHADALEANRRRELNDAQRRNIRAWANSNRRGALSLAGVFLAIAVLVGVFAPATAPPVTRAVITAVSLLLALGIGLRAIVGLDALTRDVRAGRVESVEGAIGKRGSLVLRHNSSQTKILQVGNQRFKVGPSTYKDAPDAGFVRVYYLPRSRKVVNLERLERAVAPELTTKDGVMNALGEFAHAHGVQERDVIRARVTDAMDQVSVGFTNSPVSAATKPLDLGSLAVHIVGTWSNAMMMATVTFRQDGTVSARMGGMQREGRWSVDADGRLSSDITGENEVADASISGDQLTIAMGGQGFKFKRDT